MGTFGNPDEPVDFIGDFNHESRRRGTNGRRPPKNQVNSRQTGPDGFKRFQSVSQADRDRFLLFQFALISVIRVDLLETNPETTPPFVSSFVSSKPAPAGPMVSSGDQKSFNLPIKLGCRKQEAKIPWCWYPFVSSWKPYTRGWRKRTTRERTTRMGGKLSAQPISYKALRVILNHRHRQIRLGKYLARPDEPPLCAGL